MVNEEILGGLISAMERGQSMESAMNSFFNAGYNRAEIEEAARVASEQPIVPIKISETSPVKIPKPVKESFFRKLFSKKEKKPAVPIPASVPTPTPSASANQKVSYYGKEKPKTNFKIFIIILSVILALIGIGILLLFLFVL
ncbi:MAG: hypothetical protein PHQ66_03035 [Candidatus Nanoarchaeia archaeon]|nr:hypothetical protein [Candidatus Nanoarchaeia archaeon]MDD5357659.1 hypothetical protein [Candidatus Nanoarchaeia archaeon]MDD5588578.1 hypothetical protein [Candidatus Nanoarchaeia archaeon]